MIDHLFDRYSDDGAAIRARRASVVRSRCQTARRSSSRLLSTFNTRRRRSRPACSTRFCSAADAAQAEAGRRASGSRGAIRSACIQTRSPRCAGMSHEHADAAAILPTSRQAPPYIHLDRDAEGRITAIRQRREGDEMPAVGESDMGLFSLSPDAYFNLLPQFGREADAGDSHAREKFSAVPAVAGPARTLRADVSVDERDGGHRHQHAGRSPAARGVSARAGAAVKRLSIVIPAYNEERFIGTLLERIRAVDLTPHGLEKEIIVVDDCSKDGTAEVVTRFPMSSCAATSATAARAGPCGRASSARPATT